MATTGQQQGAFDFGGGEPAEPPVAAPPVEESPPPEPAAAATRDRTTSAAQVKEIAKALRRCSGSRGLWDVFADFLYMSARTIANTCDLAQRDKREAEFIAVAARHEPATVATFTEVFGMIVGALDDGGQHFTDVLGRVFHELELHNTHVGQFFTPYDLCLAMAGFTIGDEVATTVRDKGFVTVNEPACGSGAMVIAFAEEMLRRGLNPQRQLHVVAQDIDERSVHMTYLQLSLLGIPAVVIWGDTLALEERARWYTPMHILGGWSMRLRARAAEVIPGGSPPVAEEKP